MEKKYILFDNDGVLVETEMWYYQANKKILKSIGINLNYDKYQQIMINGESALNLALQEGYTLKEISEYRKKRDTLYQEFLQTKNIAISGVKQILKYLSKKYKMAIITTSRRVDFNLIHKNRGIVDYMDFVLCVEDYEKAKPHPQPYLSGLSKFKAQAKETIVIEDSQRGLESAYRAKIDCIIVKNEFTKNHNFNKAKHFISTLEDLKKLL